MMDQLTREERIRMESFSIVNAGHHHDMTVDEIIQESSKVEDYVINGKKEA